MLRAWLGRMQRVLQQRVLQQRVLRRHRKLGRRVQLVRVRVRVPAQRQEREPAQVPELLLSCRKLPKQRQQ